MVFYGPPRFQEHINWLKSRCNLRLVETPLHDPEFVKKRVYFRNKFYGSTMKLHAYSLDTPNLFWIDSDTVITGDIREMLKEDFDVLVSKWQDGRGRTYMDELFKAAGLPHIDTMLAGFVVFKNYAHNRMRRDWLGYMKKLFMNELKPPNPERIDLPAFNLTLAKFKENGGKVVEMPLGWHTYGQADYVSHLPHREIAIKMEKKIFTPEMHKLVHIGSDKRGVW